MSRTKTTIIAFAVAATVLAALPMEANADGPLRRWLRGLRTPKTTCCSPQATTANYTPNAYNLQPGQCMKTCQQTCSRTVVNYVPYTAYRQVQKRVPVTQYRPVTNSDPCTGCTVTCMKPCTTYTYQCQRVPYTTYRPVYRQESYKVPVTTIVNDCSTGACGPCDTGVGNTGCNACGTGAVSNAPANYAPNAIPTPAPTTSTYYESYPANGVISTDNGYGTTTSGGVSPADQTPSLLNGVNPQSSQRPVLDQFNSGSGSYNYQTSTQRKVDAPAMINIEDKTAQSPVRKQWSYSPVRMASYTNPTTTRAQSALRADVQPVPQANWSTEGAKRNGWVEVN